MTHEAGAELVAGVHVVAVQTTEDKYRRRVYFGLAAAQRAADRAIEAGHEAQIVLCQLVPVVAPSTSSGSAEG